MFFLVYGSQTAEEYSNSGRTSDLYDASVVDCLQECKFLSTNPKDLLASAQVSCTCLF